MQAPMKTPGAWAGREETKRECSGEQSQSAMVDTATRKALATLQAEFAIDPARAFLRQIGVRRRGV